MRRTSLALLLWLAATSPAWATARTSNGTGGGNANTGASWSLGVAPADGDTITVLAGDTITQDVNRTYGSSGSSVGHAFTLNGTSSLAGTLRVNSGVTLTLAGTDVTTNTLGLINQYGQFLPQSGSTIVGVVASDGASCILNNGIITASGVTFTTPLQAGAWTNAISGEALTSNPYDWGNSTGAVPRVSTRFGHTRLSNAAMTGPGSVAADITFAGTGAGTIFANFVGSDPESIAASGDYAVDFDLGAVWAYFATPSTGWSGITVSYKYFGDTPATSFFGWFIKSAANTDYNEATFANCTFTYFGTQASAKAGLFANHKYSDTALAGGVAVHRRKFAVTGCTFSQGTGLIALLDCNGANGDPIPITGNTFGNATSGYYAGHIGLSSLASGTGNQYVSISTNTFRCRTTFIASSASTAITDYPHLTIANNTGIGGDILSGIHNAVTFGNGTISGNTHRGVMFSGDRWLFDVGGQSAGAPLSISGNSIVRIYRALGFCSFTRIYNNRFTEINDEAGVVCCSAPDSYTTNIRIYNNLFDGVCATTATGNYNQPSISLCYFTRQWVDDVQVYNNTSTANRKGCIAFGQSYASNYQSIGTRIVGANNLATLGSNTTNGNAWYRDADNSTRRVRMHIQQFDYNLDYNYTNRYNNTNANSPSLANAQFPLSQGTFAVGGVNYSTLARGSRNVPGVSLQCPSFSSKSGGSLALAAASKTSVTLAWGAGTAVQLVQDSGTLGGTVTVANNTTSSVVGLRNGTFADSSKTWSTVLNVSTCQCNRWLVVWKTADGTGLQIVQILNATGASGNSLTIAPAWSPVPPTDGSYSYAIYETEVTLADGAETVAAGIYLPDLWGTSGPASGTDTGISFADHSVTGTNPLVTDPNAITDVAAKWTTASPAKNVGTATGAPTTDYFGAARPQGSAFDIGFFELAAGATGAAALLSAGD